MSSTKIFPFLFFLSFLPLFPADLAAQTKTDQGVFISVSGNVTVTHGKKSSSALKDSTVKEGQTVVTGKNSTATLRFFDGSEVRMKPETQFTLSKLQKIGAEDKAFKFKLALGKLFAAVKKLASAKSSFEIEAGGVVCGVRGTEYEVDYDPDHNQVDILVTDGNVWAEAGGETFQYGPGGEGHFTDGKPGPDNGVQGHGGRGSQGNNFSPFYGMNGNQPDPFQSPAGLPEVNGVLADQTSNDNLLGLGAHTLILQLKYPEQ